MEFGPGTRIVALLAAGALGAGALSACGGSGEGGGGPSPAPVATGEGAHQGDANRCTLTIERSGPNFIGHAVVNGTIPGGSELVYKVTYQATWADGSYTTPERRTAAGGTMDGPGVTQVNGKERKFFGFSGKIDLKGKSINLPCGSATLDDLK